MHIGSAFLEAFLKLTDSLLSFYIWLLIASAALSWLVAFDIVNPRNRFVSMVGDFCYRLTEPLLRPIRKYVHSVGGLDVAPLVLIFAIYFAQVFIESTLRHLILG